MRGLFPATDRCSGLMGREVRRRSFPDRLPGRTSRGVTLVELLVVIAILGVLLALLLPAVATAREAARRAGCKNNLRETGLALVVFESQHASFPVGCVECRSLARPPRFVSWLARLLPMLDASSVHDQIDFEKPMWDPVNKTATATVIGPLLCPSTEKTSLRSTSGMWRERAFSDYGGLYGVEGTGNQAIDPASVQTLAPEHLGVMLYEESTRREQITDGASHTAMVAEMRLRRVAGECEWANGHQVFAQERTTPVNAASGLGNDIGSPHPGGALAVFCDGHVAWLSESTDVAVLNAWLTRAGGEISFREGS